MEYRPHLYEGIVAEGKREAANVWRRQIRDLIEIERSLIRNYEPEHVRTINCRPHRNTRRKDHNLGKNSVLAREPEWPDFPYSQVNGQNFQYSLRRTNQSYREPYSLLYFKN